ncbi:MAG: hypothetical protein RR313_04020, partial [Anaerovoracaceae bacterium]
KRRGAAENGSGAEARLKTKAKAEARLNVEPRLWLKTKAKAEARLISKLIMRIIITYRCN